MISVNLSQFLVVYLTTVALIQAYWLTGHKKQYHYLTTVLFICYTCNMATFQSQHNGCLWSIKKLILCMILTLEEKEVEPLKLGWRSLDHAKMKITCTGCYSALSAFMSLTFTLRDWEKKEEKRLSADSLNHCKIVVTPERSRFVWLTTLNIHYTYLLCWLCFHYSFVSQSRTKSSTGVGP